MTLRMILTIVSTVLFGVAFIFHPTILGAIVVALGVANVAVLFIGRQTN